jgi:type III protein arginine methyltransferase
MQVPASDDALIDAAFEPLLAAAAGDARTLAVLAMRAGPAHKRRALDAAREALALAPDDPEVTAIARSVLAADVPLWHFAMMRDEPRNAAYQAAIERAVKPGMRVLDIGSGSGLLAMMAARAGAAHVVTCEVDPAIAAVTEQIVAANGFGDVIAVLNRHSSTLDVDADLGGPVDCIISEIIGKDLVCEKVLPSLADARRRFLKPGGTMIPATGEIRVALAWWEGYTRIPAQADQCGFDLSAFNQLLPPRWSINVGDRRLTVRSTDQALMRFDLTTTTVPDRHAALTLESVGGPVNGVIQWIALDLDGHHRFENPPEHGAISSWACIFYPFPAPLESGAGQPVPIGGRVVGDMLRIWQASAVG